jgi:Glycosyl transferase family 2
MNPRPLLSVVVPTYQRAAMLRVMLQALLPQVAALRDWVEVCIGDNASTDGTADVVQEAMRAVPGAVVRLVRRDHNLGAIRNLVLGATEDARGEFVWAIGDDDLVTPGTVRRICDALGAHAELDYFYVNFAMASFPLHWPASAHGGYVGAVCDVAHDYRGDRLVRHWQELIDHTSSLATQVYAHVVRRDVWTRYWAGRDIPADYHSVQSTYPHTAMLVDEAWDQPALFLSGVHLVLFNDRPGWGEGQAARIVLVAFPMLVARLDDRGLGIHTLMRARKEMGESFVGVYRSLLTGPGGPDAVDVIHTSLAMGSRYPELVSAVVTAIQTAQAPLNPELVAAVRDALERLQPIGAAA